jgi:putative ATP-binding cassette transporter
LVLKEREFPSPEIESVPESIAGARRRLLFRRFWRSALGFWRGPSGRTAWLLTGALLATILIQLFIQYRLNVWNRDIFDALQKKDFSAVGWLALVFVPLAVAAVGLNVASVWGRLTTQRTWRAWLSNRLIDRWLENGRYYQLNLVSGEHQNPEYRIAEDARVATESPVDFAFGIITAVLTAVTFIGVLWAVGGGIGFTLGGREVYVPGFLVIVAVLYAAITTTAMIWIARAFVSIAEAKNQAEADFRYAATRLREYGESIALLGGDQEERSGLAATLGRVVESWRRMCHQYMRTTVVSYTNFVVAPVVPLILCAPKFLAGTMSLGEVMQAATAFVTVQQSFNWLVENYPKMADWTASVNRVASLVASLDGLERAERPEAHGRITRAETQSADAPVLRLNGVSVTLDDGTGVVGETEVAIDAGERVLVVGESGTGKSTLVRAIAGLWPWGEGEVVVRAGARLFFMPQRPYVPIGTLKRAVAYPAAEGDIADEDVAAALRDAGLGHLAERLHEQDIPWERTLSGGEQQRLAFAQLFVHRPDVVVMDEATSALDTETQARLLTRLGERLPRAALVSVGHRPELEAFHDRRLVLARRSGGARLVRDEALERNAIGRFLERVFGRAGPRPVAPP